jgi:predicted MFS family arabinose efflux permease
MSAASPVGLLARTRERRLDGFVVYRALSRAYFHLPILFVYLYTGGLSLITVEVLLAVYGLVIVVASPLSKRLITRFSMRDVVAAGELAKVVGVGLLAAGTHLYTTLPAQIIGALGYSIAAGTDSALLAALAGGDRELYRGYETKSAAFIFPAALAGGVIGAVLFTQQRALPFYASAVLSAAAFCTVLLLAPRGTGAAGAPGAGRAERVPALPAADRFWLRYYAISRAFVLAPYVGFLPYLFYVTLRVHVAWFGVILGVYGATSFVVARYSRTISARLGARRLGWASMALCAAGLAVLGLAPALWAALIGVFLLGLGGGVVRPVTMTNLDAAMTGWTPAQRTSLLSAQESHYGAWNTAILLLGAVVIDQLSVRDLLVGLAVAYGLILAGLATARRRAD